MRIAVLVVLLSLGCSCQFPAKVPCSPGTYSELLDGYDYRCHYNATEEAVSSRKKPLPMRVNWNYLDVDNGDISISILGLLPPKLMRYRVDLCRSKSETAAGSELILHKNRTTENFCGLNGFLLHSSRTVVKMSNTELISCQELQNITFSMVSSGVYMIEIRLFSSRTEYYSSPVHFDTKFNPQTVTSEGVKFSSHYKDDYKRMYYIISNIKNLRARQLTLIMNHKYNESSEPSVVGNQIIALEKSNLKCLLRKPKERKCNYFEDRDKIECYIGNVTTGFYNLEIEVMNDLCKERTATIWNNINYNCTIIGSFEEVSADRRTYTPASTYDSRITLVFIFLASAFTLVALAVMFFFKKHCLPDQPADGLNMKQVVVEVIKEKPELLPERPQIYLMYARDCPEFMGIMKIFRTILQKNFEVYDCFDEDRAEEIARIGTAWSEKCIANKNVKVVLVESRCAKLQLEAHMTNLKISYQHPGPQDNYFMYSLKLLLGSPWFNSYSKLFIVRIPGFFGREDELSALTPYNRYCIPEALETLLVSISQQYNMALSSDWVKDLLKLEEAILKLNTFASNEGDYLGKILVRTQDKGIRR